MMIYTNRKEMMDHMKEVNGRMYPKIVRRTASFIMERDELIRLVLTTHPEYRYKKYRDTLRLFVEHEMINEGKLFGSIVE